MATSPTVLSPGSPASAGQDRTLYRIYVMYRFVLALLLILMLVTSRTEKLVGHLNPDLYQYAAACYLLVGFASLLTFFSSNTTNNPARLFVVFFIDIIAITVMSDASGGIASGLPTLLTITIAASAVLLSGTIATLVAALSAIAVLSDTLRLVNLQVLTEKDFFPSGLLGILFFSTSVFVQLLVRRLRLAQTLALQRTQDLYSLQRLNEQIVENMQTGILLVDKQHNVKLINPAATRLLTPGTETPIRHGLPLSEYNINLAHQFFKWQSGETFSPSSIVISDDAPKIMPSFSTLQAGGDNESLIFIEDYSNVIQQLQQLKLASLGRLTASIAHEIRNPLSAAGHAAQLLSESEHLDAADTRLTDIIHTHVKRMDSIVENVQQTSRREPSNPKSIKLAVWLQGFREEIQASYGRKTHIEIDIDPEDLQLIFDESHLRQIVTNLVGNALRHSQPSEAGQWAKIIAEKKQNQIVMKILDNGPGISESEQSKVFEPFYTTAERGSGLGLYVSRELCEINKASLNYVRIDDKYSCFQLHIAS